MSNNNSGMRQRLIVPSQVGNNMLQRLVFYDDGSVVKHDKPISDIEELGLGAVISSLDPISCRHSIATGGTGAAFMMLALHTLTVECEKAHDRIFRTMPFSGAAMLFAMHDIGKGYIPKEIVTKNGILSKEEREIMRRHSIVGEIENSKIFAKIQNAQFRRFAGMIAEYHHSSAELGRPDCPLIVHIATLADILDALGSDRSYRKAMPLGEIRTLMNKRVKEKYLDEVLTNEVVYRNWDFVERLLLIRQSLVDLTIESARNYFDTVELITIEQLLLLERDMKKIKVYGCPLARGYARA